MGQSRTEEEERGSVRRSREKQKVTGAERSKSSPRDGRSGLVAGAGYSLPSPPLRHALLSAKPSAPWWSKVDGPLVKERSCPCGCRGVD